MALTKSETIHHGMAAAHKPLSPKHIFKLAYALALPGRFRHDLARFMKCAYLYEQKQKPATDDGSRYARGFHEACLLAQGFYQIESDDIEDTDDDDNTWATLPARIDRVWTATRMFLMRGLVSMGDGNGNTVDRVDAVSNPATHACVNVPEYDDDTERALFPDEQLQVHDLPALLPRWNKLALPKRDVNASYSTSFLWACAGCTLGTHCIPVPEWHRRGDQADDRLALETVTTKVASVVRRLQFNERQRKMLEEKDAAHEQCAVYMRHRRLWVPFPGPLSLVPGPVDQSTMEATATELHRLLAAKDREHRLLQRVVGKPWMVAPAIRSQVEAEAKAEALKRVK